MSCGGDNYCHEPNDPVQSCLLARLDGGHGPGTDGGGGPMPADANPEQPDAQLLGLDGSSSVQCPPGWHLGPYTSDFSEGLPPWASTSVTNPGFSITFEGGAAKESLWNGGEAWGDVYANEYHTGRNRLFRTHVNEVPRSDYNTEAMIILYKDPQNKLGVGVSAGMIYAAMLTNNSGQDTWGGNYAGQSWWQIREEGGTLFFEVSSDGQGWQTVQSKSTPAYYDDVNIDLGSGTYGPGPTSNPGRAIYDLILDCEKDAG